MLLSSGFFGLELVVWAMLTVNLQKMARIRLFKKNLLFKKFANFSTSSFKIGVIGIVKYYYFPFFGLEPVVWAMLTVNLQKNCLNTFI